MGVRNAEVTDEREDLYCVVNNVKGTPLSPALLDVQGVAGPIHVAHHQSIPVSIAVESEFCATGSLKLDGPHHWRLILLIELVSHVNVEE